VCGLRKCSWMSLTAPSNELEITPGSFLNTRSARAECCFGGFPTWSFFEKRPAVWKSLPWHTDVAAPGIGGIEWNNASAFLAHSDIALKPELRVLCTISPRKSATFRDLTPEAYAITLYDPQFAIWASLLQRGRNPSYVRDHACFVLAFEPQHDDAGVQSPDPRVGRTRPSLRTRAASPSSSEPTRRSSQTVSASKPHSRSVAAASAGRFSSVLILTRSARAEETWCLPVPIRQHRKGTRQCPRASMKDSWQGSQRGQSRPRYCRGSRRP
jgi:hypothetical protein